MFSHWCPPSHYFDYPTAVWSSLTGSWLMVRCFLFRFFWKTLLFSFFNFWWIMMLFYFSLLQVLLVGFGRGKFLLFWLLIFSSLGFRCRGSWGLRFTGCDFVGDWWWLRKVSRLGIGQHWCCGLGLAYGLVGVCGRRWRR